MQMGKNSPATCSKLIKWVRYYQISYLLPHLCHLTNTKLVFFQFSLSKIKKTLHENNISVAKKISSSKLQKSHDMTRPTFPKLTASFNLFQWTQTKTKIALWQPIKLIYVISRGLNKKRKWTCRRNCTVKCPKSKMNELLLNVPPFWVFYFVYILTKFFKK